MTKTERKITILNAIVMYINSLQISKERTDLLHLMEELEQVCSTNTFNTRMAIIYSIGAETDQVIEAIKRNLNIDLVALRENKNTK